MVFAAIIALFFGFLMVSFGLVLATKMGALLAGLLVGVFAFLGSQRLAHGKKSIAEIVVGVVCTLLPVWVIPEFMESDFRIAEVWPALVIVTFAVLLAVAATMWMERKR